MEQIQRGRGARLRIIPHMPDGRRADLRFSEGLLPYLVKPCGDSSALREGVRYNERTQDILVELPPFLLEETGAYSVILNARMGRAVWATAAVPFAEVVEEGGRTAGPLAPIIVIAELGLLDWPANVVATGASPRIGGNGNWLCWDDSMLCYVDTGVSPGQEVVGEITAEEVEALWGSTEAHV